MEFLTEEQIAKIGLPKWPGCDVDGISVSLEQAAEILVRTNSPYFSTNDREFGKQVEKIFYTAIPHPDWGRDWWVTDYTVTDNKERIEALNKAWERQRIYRNEMRVLDLEYLCNHRVCSSYIGGPHGWCNWNGVIYQRNINIGKWPSAIEVFKEWKTIAQAFPYLELTCRLLDHEAGYHKESGYEAPQIAVVFEVKGGEVQARLPEAKDYAPDMVTQESNIEDSISTMFFSPFGERGVSTDVWRRSCHLVAPSSVARVFTSQMENQTSQTVLPIQLVTLPSIEPTP